MTNLTHRRVQFGPFEADLRTRELWRHGIRIKLGGQPYRILMALLEKPGELVSREELRKLIWADDTFVDFSHGLNAAVNKLREALCDSPDAPRYIETLPRRGYRFTARVEEVSDVPSAAATVPAAPPPPPAKATLPSSRDLTFVDEDWQSSVPVKRRTLVHVWVALAVLALFVLEIARASFDWYQSNSAQVAEHAKKLVAERRSPPDSPAIWKVDLTHANQPEAPTHVISLGQEAIGGPQPSPDGKRLAFQSGTTEGSDIWVSNLDGSSPQRLTNMGPCGVPRWSPDSRSIAFDTDGRGGHSGIFIVAPDTGTIQEIVKDAWNNSVPSWSRDGKWIYFASNRAMDGEENQVWKVSVDGSHHLVQVTRHGGFSAYESLDGRTLYYAKHRYENPEIWQVPPAGGEERRVSSLVHPSTWANWSVTRHGIIFLSEYTEKSSTLEFFEFATQGVRPLKTLKNASFWLSSSLDGKSVWYSELTDNQARQVFTASME
jgi:DNA-binding winged helix-turn-helix (wHTH) protein/dipeptidyl aminopeptidase/acylaminoacyl peptidase